MENLPGIITQTGFVAVTILFYGFLLAELKKALRLTPWDSSRQQKIFNRTVYALVGWSLIISSLSLSGFVTNFSTFPPRFVIVLVIPLVTIIIISFSKTLKEILLHVPARNIIRLQIFRVFVEILLWMLLLQNQLPIQMSFEGQNFDVISGLTAPIAAYWFANNPVAIRIWNFISLALLINIVTIAILSLPTPLRVFMNEPANTVVAEFPYIFLPGLLVPLAYGLHFFSLRQLAIMKDTK